MSNISKSVVAIGTFDGVHLGHQKIIKQLLYEARTRELEPVVVTFFPHPSHVLTPESSLKMIASIDERVELLKSQEVARVVVQEFSAAFAKKSALDFIKEMLLEKLHMKVLIVGYDHSFGRDKEANFEKLLSYGKKYDFDVVRIDAYEIEQEAISSSLIRTLIRAGEIKKVNRYLGSEFCLFGSVVKGNQLGRKIGFNTANIALDYPNKIVPRKGVYVVQSQINDTNYFGMMNIGFRPTVNGRNQTIEVHFFNLNKNLYESKIRVYVLYRLRDEYKFASIEDLKNQLEIDKINALALVKEYK